MLGYGGGGKRMVSLTTGGPERAKEETCEQKEREVISLYEGWLKGRKDWNLDVVRNHAVHRI